MENNIKMYLKEVTCENLDCIRLAVDNDQWRAFSNTVMKCHKGGS
jgi:hypothetical protein